MCTDPSKYECSNCLKTEQKKYSTIAIPKTELSSRMEKRVNNFLTTQDANSIQINIRVSSSTDSTVVMLPEMQEIFEGASNYDYRAKTILAFYEELNAVSSQCLFRNTDRIAHLQIHVPCTFRILIP